MTAPEDQNGPREALGRVSVLAALPGLQDRIVTAFGRAAWVDQGGISVHGSDDGGRLAMNHSGWAALPALLDEALAPVGSLIAEWDANRASLRAAEAEITRLKEWMEALGAALKPFADEAEAISESSFSHFDDDSLAPSRFEIGELRRAAEALATLSPKEQS